MKKCVYCNILIAFLFTISSASYAQNIVYVDLSSSTPAGVDNTSCGAIGAPCATISYAMGRATVLYGTSTATIKMKSTGTYDAPSTINRSNTIISGIITTIPLNAALSRNVTQDESRWVMDNSSITINNGVNNITIEGFEFRGSVNNATPTPFLTFENGGVNSNIVLRRNSIVGASRYSGGMGAVHRVKPFLVKDNTGSLTNVQIVENRFFGYEGINTAVITINTVESGAIRRNVFGSSSQYSSFNLTSNYLEKGIVLTNAKNFAIAQNHFQGMNQSAIELLSTSNVGAATNDAVVRIDSNTFDRVNLQTMAAPTITPSVTEPANIGAAILLGANSFTGDSVLIRFNEFINVTPDNTKISIAIPNANNAFATNSIKIFSNKFSETNSITDIYVGSDNDNPTGKIDVNANWWGKTTDPYTPTISGTSGTTSDIFGGLNPRTNAQPVIWLTSSADANSDLAFIPVTKKVVSNRPQAELPQIFAAIPENWELDLIDDNYSTIPTVVKSFILNPRDAAANGEIFPGLILNGTNSDGSAPVVTLSKNIQIANGANVTLTRGKIQLGTYTMRVLGSSGLPEGNANSYIITNGTGKLLQTGIGTTKTGEVIFPIGTDNTSYTPARITNTGTSDDFSVYAQNGITTNGNDGNAVTEDAVDLTWDVTEGTVGGSNVTLTLQWNGDPVTGNEQLNFDRSVSYMAHYTGGKWVNLELPPGTAALAGTISDSWKKTASGITSFSPFAIGSPGAALPVRLVDFKAGLKNNDVILSWITASEKDNSYFSVERSEDGRIFSEIGKVGGKGTTDISNAYEFIDEFATEIGQDVLYYRLKQVDTDGKFSYSKIQNVVLQNLTLRLFPNPANHIVNIVLPGKAQLHIINSQGQVVLQKEFDSFLQLNVANLAKGVYIFKFSNGRDVLFRKVNIF